MKIRYQMAAIASAVAIMALGMAAAHPASASTDDQAWCTSTGCLWSNGLNHQLTIKTFPVPSNITRFQEALEGTWENHTVYEWEQAGTDNCLEYDTDLNGTPNAVRMDTCTSGRLSQEWWHTGSDGFLVNAYAGSIFPGEPCMDKASTGEGVIIDFCSTYSVDHYWALNSDPAS